MDLPEGWKSENFIGKTVLDCPNDGSVTICFAGRGFCLGWSYSVKSMPGYTGRGWKERLYADAVNALR